MAKQNYLKLAVAIVLTMAASTTVHATTVLVGTSIGGSSFSASNKVSCYYDSNATASGLYDGTAYAIACGHSAGDKVIAAISGDAKLYFSATGANEGASGAASITCPFTFDTTWSSM